MTVDTALRPLDRVRAATFRAFSPTILPFVIDRDVRVALLGCASVTAAFALTCAAPFWLLGFGPILLGVPHLLADVRYLVVRPRLHRRRALWIAAGLPLLLVGFMPGLRIGLLAAAGVLLVARASAGRKVIAFVAWTAIYGFAWWGGKSGDVVFAQLHNGIAVLLWLLWRERRGFSHWVIVALMVVGSVAILAGIAGDHLSPGVFALGSLTETLSPTAAPSLAARFVLLFAFAQAVHYTVWLRLIPEDDRPSETPRSFRRSWRALVEDFGKPALVATAAIALAIAVWGALDLVAARDGYLRLAFFHGHLEIAAAALIWIERQA